MLKRRINNNVSLIQQIVKPQDIYYSQSLKFTLITEAAEKT